MWCTPAPFPCRWNPAGVRADRLCSYSLSLNHPPIPPCSWWVGRCGCWIVGWGGVELVACPPAGHGVMGTQGLHLSLPPPRPSHVPHTVCSHLLWPADGSSSLVPVAEGTPACLGLVSGVCNTCCPLAPPPSSAPRPRFHPSCAVGSSVPVHACMVPRYRAPAPTELLPPCNPGGHLLAVQCVGAPRCTWDRGVPSPPQSINLPLPCFQGTFPPPPPTPTPIGFGC